MATSYKNLANLLWGAIMKARKRIVSIRDFEKFLRSRGFSRKESMILAKGWKELEKISFLKGAV